MLNKRLAISFFFLVLSFILNPEIILAKSGCCSSHDGVNCSAGPQSNGKVICNDGWRGSSCLYSEMVMCGGSSYTTTTKTVTSTPAPIYTTTPKPIYTNTPKPTYTSTPKPTKTPTSTPTETETPTPSRETAPESISTVNLTEKSNEESSEGGGAVLLSLVGGAIYLFKKFKK